MAGRPHDEIMAEKGLAHSSEQPVSTEEADESTAQETRPANRVHYGAAVVDVLIAILPLYFVAFAGYAYSRNNTLANTFTNQAVFRMAGYNPTIFPILFALIVTKFIKAVANWKLERGATVGHIQHLLGSRSLVSSVTTPMKLKVTGIFVPLLCFLWILNPIGGQMSLRVASPQSNYTVIDSSFSFLDPTHSAYLPFPPNSARQAVYIDQIDAVFTNALMTPASSKNGTQDIYGNVQVPMLEDLKAGEEAALDGWYYTSEVPRTGLMGVAKDLLEVPHPPVPIYMSLTGIPFLNSADAAAQANSTSASNNQTKVKQIEQTLFGPNVINNASLFTMELSYIRSDCSVNAVTAANQSAADGLTFPSNWAFSNDSNTVTNNMGMSIYVDDAHNYNSTTPRRIGFRSAVYLPGNETSSTQVYGYSEAWCNLTTEYVEARVLCPNGHNCSVIAVRESTKDHLPAAITVLDMSPELQVDYFAGGLGASDPTIYDYVSLQLPVNFFQQFLNATVTRNFQPESAIVPASPLANYFVDPANPYSDSGMTSGAAIYQIGDKLFSQRMSQLLNTFWLTSIAPFSMSGSFTSANLADGKVATASGQTQIETIVLRCQVPYLALLIAISSLLFLVGLLTAYMDATRKGPDVLDDFVNSLRHSPYVHVDQGPSMEDGPEKARRLRSTVIKMGDVRPDGEVGYVAIGTPSEQQPVHDLRPTRQYT